jgi:prevent-host-death family protein
MLTLCTHADSIPSKNKEVVMAKSNVLGVREARARFSELLEQAQFRGEEFLIERSGKPFAVIMGADRYEELRSELATLQEARSPDAHKRLQRGKADIAAGRLTSHEEIVQRLSTARKS